MKTLSDFFTIIKEDYSKSTGRKRFNKTISRDASLRAVEEAMLLQKTSDLCNAVDKQLSTSRVLTTAANLVIYACTLGVKRGISPKSLESVSYRLQMPQSKIIYGLPSNLQENAGEPIDFTASKKIDFRLRLTQLAKLFERYNFPDTESKDAQNYEFTEMALVGICLSCFSLASELGVNESEWRKQLIKQSMKGR